MKIMRSVRAYEWKEGIAYMRGSILFRCMALALVGLLMSVPPLCDVALAQSAPKPPSQAIATRVVVTQVSVVADEVVKATVGYGDRSANVEIRKTGLTFGEGYALRLRRLAETRKQDVIQMIAEAPDGRTEHATLRVDRASGQATAEGLAKVRGLLAESGKLELVEAAMPLISSAALDAVAQNAAPAATSRASTDALKPTPNGLLGCIGAAIGAYGAALLVIGACGIPEPVEPIVCAASIIVLVGCLLVMVEECDL